MHAHCAHHITVGRNKGSRAHLVKSQQKVAIEMWFWSPWKWNKKLDMKKWQSPKFLTKWGAGTKNQKMLVFVSTMYKWPILATETSYKVKNTRLLWPRVQSYEKIKIFTFFFIFCCFWGQNHQKNAFSAHLTPPKMPDTILVGVPFVLKMPSDWP